MSSSAAPALWSRPDLIARLSSGSPFDLLIVGGGATGLGLALDASLRGLRVALLETRDFAGGTSSRATKLIHGGVRYLAQGNVALVRQALHERRTILNNAPHVVGRLGFVMPAYRCWDTPFYGLGLKAYDVLAGRDSLGSTHMLSRQQVCQLAPGIAQAGLKAGVRYWDAQFDDARLALLLARTAATQGAVVMNYCRVDRLVHQGGRVAGVVATDVETGQPLHVAAHCVVNATGVWVDHLRQADAKALSQSASPMVKPSQGAHVVVDAGFFPGGQALLVPRTSDGRVLFAVPWLGKLILGTTDTPRTDLPMEPLAREHDVQFILAEAGRYLQRAPTLSDVRSVWAGLRPLVQPPQDPRGVSTASLSREHTIDVSVSGLVTVTGGKWTTYRVMAEDVLSHCMQHGLLPRLPASRTAHFPLLGAQPRLSRNLTDMPGLDVYGSEAPAVESLARPDDQPLSDGLTPAMVRFAVRHEFARRVEDVLARRSRLLFLDAARAAQLAGDVARIMRAEGIHHPHTDGFMELARTYQMPAAVSI